ncbi:MAG TPA: flavodoxin [Patescibacteria group bacterium]
MKTLVIYYSLEGNTKFIAQKIAEATGADILELKLKKETVKPHSLSKYFWGGKQVMMKEKPELVPFEIDPDQYNLLFIGTPVWAWNYSPPINTFLSSTKLADKKIALFCSHGGAMGKTFENMEKELSGNKIVGKIDFKEPLKNNPEECAVKAKEWAIEIISAA